MGREGGQVIGQEHACAVGGCGEGGSEHQDSQEGQEDLSPEDGSAHDQDVGENGGRWWCVGGGRVATLSSAKQITGMYIS